MTATTMPHLAREPHVLQRAGGVVHCVHARRGRRAGHGALCHAQRLHLQQRRHCRHACGGRTRACHARGAPAGRAGRLPQAVARRPAGREQAAGWHRRWRPRPGRSWLHHAQHAGQPVLPLSCVPSFGTTREDEAKVQRRTLGEPADGMSTSSAGAAMLGRMLAPPRPACARLPAAACVLAAVLVRLHLFAAILFVCVCILGDFAATCACSALQHVIYRKPESTRTAAPGLTWLRTTARLPAPFVHPSVTLEGG